MLRPVNCLLLLLLVSCLCIPTGAQSFSPWTLTPGDNTLTLSADGLHIDQKNDADTAHYALASRPLSIPPGKPWRIAFDVRFGALRVAGSSVRLLHAKETVGWVGADGVYKGMTAFIGADKQLPGQPADSAWHRFEFDGDGQTLSVRQDGRLIGAGPITATPDTIEVGNTQEITAASRQTEVWLRGLDIQTLPERLRSPFTSTPTTGHMEAPPPPLARVPDTSKLLLADTQQALASGLIDVKWMNLTSLFGSYTIYDLAVTNNNSNPVWFWTTPTLVLANGTAVTTQSMLTSRMPFQSYASQLNGAFNLAFNSNRSGSYSGDDGRPPGIVVQRLEDTIIPPHTRAYFHCQSTTENSDALPDHIQFNGGGWDGQILDVTVQGVRNLPQ